MAAYNKFNSFVEYEAEKIINLATDTLKVMLSNTAPIASNTVFADIVDISAGNGYTAGGSTVTITSSSQTSGVYKLVGNDVVFTASGGSIGPFRYVVFYDDTPTSPSKPLIAWWDYGSSITLAATETLTVDFDATNGILTVT